MKEGTEYSLSALSATSSLIQTKFLRKNFFSEGSEDEIEVSVENIEDLSMDRDMLPPQSESLEQFSPSQYIKGIYSTKVEDFAGDNILPKATRNDDIILHYNIHSNKSNQPCDDMRNGNADIFYLRAREIVLASGILPSELELRETGIFAKTNINKGTRYGPFQGKWASIPQDARFAWEVSLMSFS